MRLVVVVNTCIYITFCVFAGD